MTVSRPVRLAVVGGQRGRAFNRALETFKDKVQLVAVCDLLDEVLSQWRTEYPGIETFKDYDQMLKRGNFDAVFVATPMGLHADQAVKAMESGKHVVSEVIAATTIDECWKLVDTVEETGLTYMLAENYCYMRPNMIILNMVEEGVFGEITYAEGGYIHDCRNLMFYPDGTPTWRGVLRRDFVGNTYPTHSLGPVSQWLQVNREGGDRLVTTASFMTKEAAMHRYVERKFGKDHPAAKPGFFKHGDSTTTLIQTEHGVVIVLRFDATSARPHNMVHYLLQGTSASYLSARHGGEDPLTWIDGRSPGLSPPEGGMPTNWESLWKYTDEYEHPRWKLWGEKARMAGHGGGDFFILEDFVNSILEEKRPPIDVYDAVTWSSIMPLSIESVQKGGAVIDIPDFRRRK